MKTSRALRLLSPSFVVPFVAALAACSQVLGVEPGILVDPTTPDAASDGGTVASGDGGSAHPDGGAPDATSADFTIVAGTPRVDLVRGGASVIVMITSHASGATPVGPITVTTPDLPAGVTADPLTIPAGQTKGALTLRAAGAAAIDAHATLTVRATAASGTRDASARLVVRDPPGTLDVTFGAGGIATVPLPGTQAAAAVGAKGLAIQPDGKIVFCGNAEYGASNYRLIVGRVGPDGAIDASFGQGGTRVANEPAHSVDTCATLAVLPSGAIVVDGFTLVPNDPTYPHAFMAARLTSAGALDSTFGSGGFVWKDIGKVDSKAYDMVVQPDGRLVLGGFVSSHPALLRLLPDGGVDTTFGANGDGTVTDTVEGPIMVMERLANNDVLTHVSTSTFLSARFDIDGRPVTSYADAGHANASAPAALNGVTGSLVQSDGSVILVAAAGDASGKIELARFDPTGALDPTFGDAGIVSTPITSGQLVTGPLAATQDDGFVLAASMPDERPFLVRYDHDGAPVASFGDAGVATLSGTSWSEALAIDDAGRIVMAFLDMNDSLNTTGVTLARFWP